MLQHYRDSQQHRGVVGKVYCHHKGLGGKHNMLQTDSLNGERRASLHHPGEKEESNLVSGFNFPTGSVPDKHQDIQYSLFHLGSSVYSFRDD